MGIISKQVHKRTTNKIVAPIRSVTRLSAEQVLVMVAQVVQKTKPTVRMFGADNRLWLVGAAPGPWTVYFGPPSPKDPTRVVPSWNAQVAITPASTGTESLVTIQLVEWKTKEGTLVDKKNYEAFRDNIHANLTAQDPSHRVLEPT